jgi:hypothetical protein
MLNFSISTGAVGAATAPLCGTVSAKNNMLLAAPTQFENYCFASTDGDDFIK